MSSRFTYSRAAETEDRVLPTPATKTLLTSPISLKPILLLTPKGEIHSFSVIKKERQDIKKKKQPKQTQTPETQLILSQAISLLKGLFGGAKLPEMAPGTIYHLSSCIFWCFQDQSGMPRYIFLVHSKDCLHSSFARSSLTQKNTNFHGSSRRYLDRSRLVRALLMWEHIIPSRFSLISSQVSHSTTRHCCPGTNEL